MKFLETATPLDVFYIHHAEKVAQQSDDPSTKTGCVIYNPSTQMIVSQSYNQLPPGVVRTAERSARPEKYLWTEHSERMCFDLCARYGNPIYGCWLYSNWFPCAECARGIIGAGIKRVIGFEPDFKHPKYGHEFEVSEAMLIEAGIDVVYVGTREQVQK